MGSVGVPDGRLELVRGKAEQWARDLTDFGPRNTLLYYRDTKSYTVDLSEADPAQLAALLAGGTGRLSRLLPEPTQAERANTAARTLRKRIVLMREEQGIEVGRLARGLVCVEPPSGRGTTAQRPLRAPLLLQSVQIEPRTAGESDHVVTLAPDVEVNPVLLVALRDHFGVDLDIEALRARLDDIVEQTTPEKLLEAAFDELQAALAGYVHTPTLEPRTVLGVFSFEKLPMVEDLRESAELLAQHDVIAAAAGDGSAQSALRFAATQHTEHDLDQVTPHEEFLVLDADSSQHSAVLAVASGQHVVIEGPPGTGKSQTIANIIADAAAEGRSVLFVTEKRAAIEAVTDRLAEAGLADLVFDLHGQGQSRAAVATQINASLNALSTAMPPDVEDLHRSLAEIRCMLTQRDEAVHAPRSPWGPSAYGIQNQLLGLPKHAATTIRISRAGLRNLDHGTVGALGQKLASFVHHGGLAVVRGESPWSSADVPTTSAAEELFVRLDSVTGPEWRTARTALQALVTRAGLRPPSDLASWQHVLSLLGAVEETSTLHGPTVYSEDLDASCAAVVPARDRAQFASSEGWWRRWQRRRAAYARRSDGRCSREVLARELCAARDERSRWQRISVDPAALPVAVGDRNEQPFRMLRDQVAAIAMATRLEGAENLPVGELEQRLQRLRDDEQTLYRLPGFAALRSELDAIGLTRLLDEAARRDATPEDAADMLQYTWYHSLLTIYRIDTPVLGEFSATNHDAHVRRFAALDKQHMERNAARVRRRVAEHLRDARDAHPDENHIVNAQAKRKRGHLSVRRLVESAEHVLLAARPCWAMSPIVVSRVLPAKRLFDIVVFDEASQVEPVDAMTSIMRGRQLVVAGDEKQLPPSDYFRTLAAGGYTDDEEEPNDAPPPPRVGDFESILACLASFVPTTLELRWHYRSEDERLIAFSNHHFYRDQLITFPGQAHDTPLRTHIVDGATAPGRGGLIEAEIAKVVELAMAHAAKRPRDSLGIITANVEHKDRIEAALATAATENEALAAFRVRMNGPRRRLFVKSLEMVQGDERDVIILSMGRAKGPTGRLGMNFGPINHDGGERRLNVAVTRAKRLMHVISAFTHEDMPPNYPRAGPRLLRSFLEQAHNGARPQELGRAVDIEMNNAEKAVLRVLQQRGIPVTPQWGISEYRIDFALADPDRPGRLVLAVEFDGDRHHHLGSARDRDRLRQAHLERMGWKFHRVWASAWFADPEGEADRIEHSWRQALTDTAAPSDLEPTAAQPDAGRPDAVPRMVPKRQGSLPVEAGHPITYYTDSELDHFARWHLSDGLPLDRETRIRQMSNSLGFKQLGSRIRQRLSDTLDGIRAIDGSS
jgi:very-short-patch-repair endonuclease